MISKIDIQKFGLFNNYSWNASIGNDTQFNRLNIIYGRNYSGKTLLSRIFRCVEKTELHKNYLDANFSIILENGNTITPNKLAEYENDYEIRVYNSDFINDNLSWLHNELGEILPFTILGIKNVELDTKIKEIDEKLGKIEQKIGLLFEYSELEATYTRKFTKLKFSKDSLEDKLKGKANDKIKVDTNLFKATTQKKIYNINDIKDEISTVENKLDEYILSKNQIDEKTRFLSEDPKTNINKINFVKPNFDDYYGKYKELSIKQIKPNKQIIDLINDSLLQEWVRQGIDKHKGKRDLCGFCGNPLPKDLWDTLDNHFSKESEDLRKDIQSHIEFLKNDKLKVKEFLKLDKNSFYSNLFFDYDAIIEKWDTTIDNYIKNVDLLISDLNEREKNIFKTRVPKIIEDISFKFVDLISELNNLIEKNNTKTLSLAKDQTGYRKSLRLSNIAQFLKDIDYKTKQLDIKKLEDETKILEQQKNDCQSVINSLLEEKRMLEADAKDESRGAELINQHLSKYFGHDELKLIADGATPNMRFKITRDKNDAKNLSEGECSLISFCYFIAKMEDEMKDEHNSKKLIIYIDDPISSLDSNHIFFMFSLIDTIIAKPNKYGQLFISTHNLDFLKYLKRLTAPDGKQKVNYFFIERRYMKNERCSFISVMPKHIEDYVTEFNYLFNEIYKVYKDVKGDRKQILENTYNQFYNFPNNLRKFLECYLFYKFPNNKKPLENLGKLFNDNIPSLINRVINEYSHLTYIERGWKPIDVNEVEECAKIIIEKIKETDPEQFSSLLDSVK